MFKFLKEKLKGLLKKSKEEIEEKVEEKTKETELKEVPTEELKEEKTIEEAKTEEIQKKEELKLEKSEEELSKEREKKVEAKPKIITKEPRKVKKVSEEQKTGEPKKIGLLEKITKKELKEKDIEKFLNDLKFTLLKCDVAFDVTEKICNDVKNALIGKVIKRGEIEKVVMETLEKSIIDIFDVPKIDIENIINKANNEGKVPIIIFLGFNGTGKTTTLAKVAYWLKRRGYTPILAAGDTFRAASIEQLEIHGKNLGCEVIKHTYGADSAAVIYDAREHAKKVPNSVVLADTAGRSHANANLMDELKKVCRVNQPDLKILVLDSLTGNDVVEQAKKFDETVGIDTIILTKADVYEKGGAAISAVFAIRKPILFLGTGQGYEDLEKFDAKKVIREIFGE